MPQKRAGFKCISETFHVFSYPVKASVNITAGDALQDDGDGDAQLATQTLSAKALLGVAAGGADNTNGGDGDINVLIIPPDPRYTFYVLVGNGALAQTDVGEIVDISAEDSVDVDVEPSTGWGFHIYEVDTTNNHVYGYWRLAG